MDQLELLKKDWQKKDHSFPKLSKNELSTIIHKRSSSIVKWIFIISVLEFVIPHLIILFTGDGDSSKIYDDLGLNSFKIASFSVYYIVIVVFIYLFYKNYKSISAQSNPKTLMHNIIKTRKIVKYYIWFNLSMFFIISVVILYKVFNTTLFIDKIPEDANMLIVWLVSLIAITTIVVIFWLFYKLIYGILLNKLKSNYEELVNHAVDC